MHYSGHLFHPTLTGDSSAYALWWRMGEVMVCLKCINICLFLLWKDIFMCPRMCSDHPPLPCPSDFILSIRRANLTARTTS